MKQTVVTFRQAKGQRKLAMLTAYDATVARLMDDHVDAVLVGDSLGMVMLGQPDTLSVTMDQMIHHCAAVSRGLTKPLLVCDMPFMSYHLSPQQACANAGRLVQEGRAQAVKLEGGRHFCPQVEAIVRASIPVMGHLGLTPQSLHSMGGYKVQGRGREAAQALLDDARALEQAGGFAIVLECVPAPLAALVSRSVSVPTIGIGAGPDCDGQVLVWQDMLGMVDGLSPKFVKHYAELGAAMRQAFQTYADEVRAGPSGDGNIPTAWMRRIWKKRIEPPSLRTAHRPMRNGGWGRAPFPTGPANGIAGAFYVCFVETFLPHSASRGGAASSPRARAQMRPSYRQRFHGKGSCRPPNSRRPGRRRAGPYRPGAHRSAGRRGWRPHGPWYRYSPPPGARGARAGPARRTRQRGYGLPA